MPKNLQNFVISCKVALHTYRTDCCSSGWYMNTNWCATLATLLAAVRSWSQIFLKNVLEDKQLVFSLVVTVLWSFTLRLAVTCLGKVVVRCLISKRSQTDEKENKQTTLDTWLQPYTHEFKMLFSECFMLIHTSNCMG